MDFRGHGRSPSTSGVTLSLRLFADDVLCTLRTLRLDSCYIFGVFDQTIALLCAIVPLLHSCHPCTPTLGHSLGGVVALACAVDNPTLFKGIFLFEPVICAPSYTATYDV